ncbi:TusE/DsrC/DsvC family sulfur relay protein [Betaproteobacteria bacterium SCN2]|jgi:tRNA 2-thiouridine synthesizing protein E|nr:TusE/DsrC/DsvC family sulfur relay protein [Betaproteobacteria bacterium SCN2]
MLHVSSDINKLTRERTVDPEFPHAPEEWNRQHAMDIARAEGLKLSDEHWEAVRALQSYYARHEDQAKISPRDLHDALDEHFHPQGGIKHLYLLFPGGPIAQGCRLAGLKAPFMASDRSFGSVS